MINLFEFISSIVHASKIIKKHVNLIYYHILSKIWAI